MRLDILLTDYIVSVIVKTTRCQNASSCDEFSMQFMGVEESVGEPYIITYFHMTSLKS